MSIENAREFIKCADINMDNLAKMLGKSIVPFHDIVKEQLKWAMVELEGEEDEKYESL